MGYQTQQIRAVSQIEIGSNLFFITTIRIKTQTTAESYLYWSLSAVFRPTLNPLLTDIECVDSLVFLLFVQYNQKTPMLQQQ